MNKRNARFNAIKCDKQASMFVKLYFFLCECVYLFRCCLPIAISFCLHLTGSQWIKWNGMNTHIAKCLLFTYYYYIGYCLSVRRAQYKRFLFTSLQPETSTHKGEEQGSVYSVSIEFHFDTYGLVQYCFFFFFFISFSCKSLEIMWVLCEWMDFLRIQSHIEIALAIPFFSSA